MGNAPASFAPPAEGRESRVFGLVILEQKKALERIVGPELIAQALARLPQDRREELEQLGMFSWCRAGTIAQLYTEVALLANRDVDGLTVEVVRAGFGFVLKTVWRMLARFSSDESLVSRAGTIYSRTVDRGRTRAFVDTPGKLVMEITDRPDLTHIDVVAISAGIETALEIAGRRARVAHRRLPDGVRFEVRVSPSSIAPPRP